MINDHDYLGSCKDCRFWDGAVINESILPDYGFCHRHPPVPITQVKLDEFPTDLQGCSSEVRNFLMDWKTRSYNLFSRPVTEADDFCGEWKRMKYYE